MMNALLCPAAEVPPLLESNGVLTFEADGTQRAVLNRAGWAFGRGSARVSVVLGPCVAMTLWSPRLQVGAIAVCTCPARVAGDPIPDDDDELYGDEVVRWADERFLRAGCAMSEVEMSLAGGASHGDAGSGSRIVSWAQGWAAQRQMKLVQQDVGGRVVRRLTFNMADGSLTIAHGGWLVSSEK
jgi:chemotaxis protein CheD